MDITEFKDKFPKHHNVINDIFYCKAKYMSNPAHCDKKLKKHLDVVDSYPAFLQAELYNLKGIILYLMNSHLTSVIYFKKAKAIGLSNYYHDIIVKASINLCAAYGTLNFSKKAYAELHKVLEFKPSPAVTGKVYHNLAAIYKDTDELEKAFFYAEKAKAVYKEVNQITEMIEVDLIAADCYVELGYEKKGIRIIKKLLKLSQEHKLHILTARAYKYIGDYYRLTKIDLKKAEQNLLDGLQIAKNYNFQEEKYALSIKLVDVYYKQNKNDQANKLADKLLKLKNTDEFNMSLRVLYQLKIDHLIKSNDLKGTIKMQQKFNEYLINYSSIYKNYKIDDQLSEEENMVLANRNDQINRQNEELKQFSFVLAHNFKEQVRNINSFANLIDLKYNKNDQSELSDYLVHINNSSKKLYQMLDKAESFIQLDLKLPYKKIDLNKVVANWLKKEKDKNIKLKTDDLPILNSNKNLLELLFNNLLDNAVKFNSKKTKSIKIKCTKTPVHFVFNVIDNGDGFNEKLSNKIFNQFYKINRLENDDVGEGLPVCKKVIRLHNGSISAQSTIGKGSTFTFLIPLDFASK